MFFVMGIDCEYVFDGIIIGKGCKDDIGGILNLVSLFFIFRICFIIVVLLIVILLLLGWGLVKLSIDFGF